MQEHNSINRMTLKLKIAFLREDFKILPSFTQHYMVVYRFYCMALYHSQTQRNVINKYIQHDNG